MKIFCAYESVDEAAVKKILLHFQPAINNKVLEIWHRGMVRAGENYAVETEKNLTSSDVVLFFLSADFLAASFFKEIEDEVIRRVSNGRQILIPILLRSCIWSYTRFYSELGLQVIPRNQLAILSHEDKEAAMVGVVQEVLAVVQNRGKNKTSSKEPVSEQANDLNSSANEAEFIQNIKKLLAGNKVNEVFQIMDNVLENSNNRELTNTAALLKSRYNEAVGDSKSGIFTSENAAESQKDIIANILELIEKIPKEIKAKGIEESAIYLDEVKKTTGFEKEQRGFSEMESLILNTDAEIESTLQQLEEKFDVENSSHKEDYRIIKARYRQLINDSSHRPLNDADRSMMDEIRLQLMYLVRGMQTDKGTETRAVFEEKEDLSTSDTVFLNEAKLIFVGNGRVGKTTLRKNLMDDSYRLDEHESTDGLEVVPWDFPLKNTPNVDSVKLNVWDFGGQGKYRAIQQFFCSSRALYIFVTTPIEQENNQDDNYTGLDYWLNFVKLFGYDPEQKKESPVIFVMNKCDLGGDQRIDDAAINKVFKNVQDFIRVSCLTGQGLDELRKTLEKRLGDTNMTNRSFPRSWVGVKDELAKLSETKDLLSFETYLDIFNEKVPPNPTNFRKKEQQVKELRHLAEEGKVREYLTQFYEKVYCSSILGFWEAVRGMDDWAEKVADRLDLEQRADALVKYLHSAGIILYYPKVNSLSNLLILNPDWARKLAYELMRSPFAHGGVLLKEDTNKVFQDLRKIYAIDLLKAYNLCYETTGRNRQNEPTTTYFIPSLFPLEEPAAMATFGAIPFTVEYRCTFSPIIPADFISRLVSRLYRYIDSTNQFWKYGVLLSKEDEGEGATKNFALVRELWRENQLVIKLVGNFWEDFLCEVANEIYSLNEEISQYQDFSKTKLREEIKLATQAEYKSIGGKRSAANNHSLLPLHIEATEKSQNLNLSKDDKAKKTAKAAEIHKNETERLAKTMLFITSCPENLEPLRFDKEIAKIDSALLDARKEKIIQLIPKFRVASAKLTSTLSTSANYVHISVHGSRTKGLLFNNATGKTAPVDGNELEDIFEELNRVGVSPKLLCLSACHSNEFAQLLSTQVEYTIGMNGFFPDEAAAIFANIFYRHLFDNRPIEFAFKQAKREIKHIGYQKDEIEVHEMPLLYKDGTLLDTSV